MSESVSLTRLGLDAPPALPQSPIRPEPDPTSQALLAAVTTTFQSDVQTPQMHDTPPETANLQSLAALASSGAPPPAPAPDPISASPGAPPPSPSPEPSVPSSSSALGAPPAPILSASIDVPLPRDRPPRPPTAASRVRQSGYLPHTLSGGAAPAVPPEPEARRALAEGCMRALRHLLALRAHAAFSTVQYTQFVHFVTPFITPLDPALAALAVGMPQRSRRVRGPGGWLWFSLPEPIFLIFQPIGAQRQRCENHREERLLEQAQARALHPPFWGSLTPCKIIILGDKIIPRCIFRL